MVEHARQVYTQQPNKTHEDHIPVHQILADKKMETLIGILMNMAASNKSGSSDTYNFEFISTLFS